MSNISLIESEVADRSLLVPMTFGDFEMRGAEGKTFPEDLRKYATTV